MRLHDQSFDGAYVSLASPQIIARIHTPRPRVRALIERLLTDVGKAHPQALIYPLTVASKSQVATRKETAENIMSKMREHSATMVDQVCVARITAPYSN